MCCVRAIHLEAQCRLLAATALLTVVLLRGTPRVRRQFKVIGPEPVVAVGISNRRDECLGGELPGPAKTEPQDSGTL